MAASSTALPAKTVPETDLAIQFRRVGTGVLRYGLALILAWVGFLKFQSYEAMAIMPLIAHSPFMAWTLGVFGLDGISRIIGTYEIAAAVLIALRPVSARLSMVGSMLAIVTFLTTLTFLLSTPTTAVYAPDHSFPFLGMIGQFLAKDIVLLGAAIFIAGDAWLAAAEHAKSARACK